MRTLLAIVVLVSGLLVTGLVATSTCLAAPNIVLFVCDDLGADVGCYGNAKVKTPAIDQLAKEGTRYTRAFCTTASCSASRSVILTGLYNHANAQFGHEHSYHHFRTYDTVKSLPVLLKDAGYRTARVGKLHVGPEEVYKFDVALPGNARNPVAMANNSREFLAAKSEQPFFLYFCTADPHRSELTIETDPHRPNAFGNREQGYPGITEQKYNAADITVPPFLPDTPTCRAELAQYYQAVSRIDQGLARLVKHLKDAGVYDNTVILFTSDHGIAFPGGKTTLYEGGMRIPLIVRTPTDGSTDRVSTSLVSTVDFTPTILDLAGALPAAAKSASFQGRSFAKTLTTANPPGFDEVYASHTFHEITMYYPMRVVRTGRYKLIWNLAHGLPFPFASDLWEAPTWQDIYKQGPQAKYGPRTVDAYLHRPKFELYDLESDPHEAKNLAESPEHRPVLDDLTGKLKAFQKVTKDPWVLKWEHE